MMRHWLVLFCLTTSGVAAETVYKSVDAEGRVTYSDQPPDTATAVETIDLPDSAVSENAADQSARRVKQMAAAADRLQQDRYARARARQEREAAAPYPVAPPVIVEERHYFGYPWAGRRGFPDIHRGRYPIRRGHDYQDRSAAPPDGVTLTPRSRLLTPN